MNRLCAVALVAVMTALPGMAEAAKLRIGGGKRGAGDATAGSTSVVTPRLGTSTRGQSASPAQPDAAETRRVPFPSTQEQPQLRLTSAPDAGPWCRSSVVVGGFCILN